VTFDVSYRTQQHLHIFNHLIAQNVLSVRLQKPFLYRNTPGPLWLNSTPPGLQRKGRVQHTPGAAHPDWLSKKVIQIQNVILMNMEYSKKRAYINAKSCNRLLSFQIEANPSYTDQLSLIPNTYNTTASQVVRCSKRWVKTEAIHFPCQEVVAMSWWALSLQLHTSSGENHQLFTPNFWSWLPSLIVPEVYCPAL